MVRWDRDGPDAATIVKEYRAGRARRNQFQAFLAGRREWLQCYKENTLFKNYQKVIDRYKDWRAGSKLCLMFVCCCLNNLSSSFHRRDLPTSFP